MLRSLLLAALVAACSSPVHPKDAVPSPTPVEQPAANLPIDAVVLVDAAVDAAPLDAAPPDAPTKKLGKHGAVCRLGMRSLQAHEGRTVLECAPGLHCCYPCGIQGCDFTCMTQAECSVDRP